MNALCKDSLPLYVAILRKKAAAGRVKLTAE